MRTNIEIDDEMMKRAKSLTGLPSKRAIVDHALRLLIARYEQADVRNLRGRLHWEGNLTEMREGRIDPVG